MNQLEKKIKELKVNPNITIINNNLWTVNFDYVINGWINGLKFHNANNESFVTVVEDIIILNSNKSICKEAVQILQDIMKLPTNKIGERHIFCNWVRKTAPYLKKKTDNEIIELMLTSYLKNVMILYMQLSELERERRKNKYEKRW